MVSGKKKMEFRLKRLINLLKIFPNSIELNKYANSRIGNILKEWFPEADMYEPIFNKYIVGKSTKKIGSNYSEANMKMNLSNFRLLAPIGKDVILKHKDLMKEYGKKKSSNSTTFISKIYF